MHLSKAAVGILAAVCVTAGALVGYLATRDVSPTASAQVVASDAFVEDLDAEARVLGGVEESEAVVAETAVPEPPPARPVTPPRRAPRPAPAVERPEPVAAPAAPPPIAAAAPAPALEAEREIIPIVPAPLEPTPPEFTIAEAIAPPPAPEAEEIELAVDSVIGLQVETPVSSETAVVEDEVVARVTRDVKVGGYVAIPAGATARGEVTVVERGGRMRDRARLGVRFTSIVLADGSIVSITTETIYREGDPPGRESATKIGGGAIGGAIIGGILGGAKGAAIGGSIGAGAGSAAVLAGGRNPATLSAGSPVTIRLQEPARILIER